MEINHWVTKLGSFFMRIFRGGRRHGHKVEMKESNVTIINITIKGNTIISQNNPTIPRNGD